MLFLYFEPGAPERRVGSKSRKNFAYFAPVKIKGGVGEMPESIFRARPTTDILLTELRSAIWEIRFRLAEKDGDKT